MPLFRLPVDLTHLPCSYRNINMMITRLTVAQGSKSIR